MSVLQPMKKLLKPGAVLVPREGARTTVEVRLRLNLSTVQSSAPRKNHTWDTRRLAGAIQDAGPAGRHESVSAGLRRWKLVEA
jgi:hypothetical protein